MNKRKKGRKKERKTSQVLLLHAGTAQIGKPFSDRLQLHEQRHGHGVLLDLVAPGGVVQLEEDQAQAEVGEGREDTHGGCGFALDVRAAVRDVVEDREGLLGVLEGC